MNEKAVSSSSVAEFFGKVMGSEEVAGRIAKNTERRQLIDKLIAARVKKGITQADVSDSLNCSQSRVSKIEHAADEDIRFGDLLAYSKALGLNVAITLTSCRIDAATRIKQHAFKIKELLEEIVDMCDGDEELQKGAARFVTLEVPFNLLNMVVEVANKLPRPEFPELIEDEDFESELILDDTPEGSTTQPCA